MSKSMEPNSGGPKKTALDVFLDELKSRWAIDTSDVERSQLTADALDTEPDIESVEDLDHYLEQFGHEMEEGADWEDDRFDRWPDSPDPSFFLDTDEEELSDYIQMVVETEGVDRAWEVVTEALQYRTYSADLLWWKSVLLAARGRFDEAETVLEEALSLSPDDDRIEATYIELLIIQGRFAAAADRIERARQRGDIGPEIAMVRVIYHLVRQQRRPLLEAFEEGARRHPDVEQWADLAVIVYKTTRAWPQGTRFFHALHQQHPDLTMPLVAAGNLYMLQKKWDSARRCYEKALEIDPVIGELHLRLSLIAIQQGRKQDALRHLRKAQEWGWDWNSITPNGFPLFLDQLISRFTGGMWGDLFDPSENNDNSNE